MRWATPEDVQSLVQLRIEMLSELLGASRSPELERALALWFAGNITDDRMSIWVAEAAGKVISTGMAILVDRPPAQMNHKLDREGTDRCHREPNKEASSEGTPFP